MGLLLILASLRKLLKIEYFLTTLLGTHHNVIVIVHVEHDRDDNSYGYCRENK